MTMLLSFVTVTMLLSFVTVTMWLLLVTVLMWLSLVPVSILYGINAQNDVEYHDENDEWEL